MDLLIDFYHILFSLFIAEWHNSAFTLLLTLSPFDLQMEDGQTLFDYNVGLNDIVQLLIRSHTDPADSPSPIPNNGEVMTGDITSPGSSSTTPTATTVTTATTASPATVSSNSGSALESQPSTSASTDLVDAGIGVYKVRTSLK